uniref:GSVIVT01012395001 n=1 Tax=Arundo donax TaxID=35708 RepID=A0A0A9CP75_ARUDO
MRTMQLHANEALDSSQQRTERESHFSSHNTSSAKHDWLTLQRMTVTGGMPDWLVRQFHDGRDNVPVSGLQCLHCFGPRHRGLGHHQLDVLRLHASIIDCLIVVLSRRGGLGL